MEEFEGAASLNVCTNRMKRESCGMEMVQLLIIDHYPVVLLNNISLDKFKQ
jgi:hypothetical protein